MAVKLNQAKQVLGWSDVGLSMEERISSEAYKKYLWARDFMNEMKKNPSPGMKYEPFSLWKHKPYQTRYIAYQDGYRKTINPKECPRKIFIFGGSTIAGDGILRDRDLIPQHLSGLLNESSASFEVRNYAVSGFGQENEYVLLALLLARGEIPDIVIFYDGSNDTLHRVGFGEPHMAFAFFKDIVDAWKGGYKKLFLKKVLGKFRNEKASISKDPDIIKKRSVKVANMYKGNFETVNKLAKSYNFKPILILQPTIFTKKILSHEEKKLYKKIINIAPSLRTIHEMCYREIINQMKGEDYFVDFRNVLDSTDKSVYVDYIHVSPLGNELIADKMFRVIKERVRDKQ